MVKKTDKKTEDKPETTKKTEAKKTEVLDAKNAEVVQPLAVSITFQGISNLKLPIALDDKGHMVVGVQFQARVDPFEIFRLVNLLAQPNGGLSATIASPQSAMDFKFDVKTKTVEVLQAVVPKLAEPKAQEKKAGKSSPKEGTAVQVQEGPEHLVKIHGVTFNHIPEEAKPFGVLIEYVNGTGEIKSAAGRGKSPTEAVVSGVKNCGAVGQEYSEPFEVRAALERLEPSPEGYKLIRVLDVGSFDAEEGKGEAEPKKGE